MKDDAKLLEVLQQEKFLAFFDLCLPADNGESSLDGLCKVAQPQDDKTLDYLSLTFIFDTPTEGTRALAERTVAKLNAEAFQKALPEVYATTSVPASVRQSENYIHQMDIIFSDRIHEDVREIIKRIVYVIRKAAGLTTEIPQWWEETQAPAPTEAEKANWTARIKALLGIKH